MDTIVVLLIGAAVPLGMWTFYLIGRCEGYVRGFNAGLDYEEDDPSPGEGT